MGSWFLAVSAAGFWLGILAADGPLAGAPPAGGLGAAAAGLVLSAWSVADAIRARGAAGGPATTGEDPGRELRGVVARRALAALVGFALLGAGWAGIRAARVRDSPVTALARAERSLRLDGTLTTDPVAGTFGWTATVRVGVVWPSMPGWPAAIRAPALLWAEGDGRPPALQAGDRVVLGGVLGRPGGSFGDYLARRGYAGTIAVDELRRSGPSSNPLARAAGAARGALSRSLQRVFPAREAGLLMGLTIGDTSRLDPVVAERFRATGLTHLLAVSGENVAMFLAPIVGLAILLGAGRSLRLVVGIVAVGFFVLLTRGEPSVMRAAAMATLTMLGVFLGRPRSPPAILGGAVLALLAWDPTLVFSAGFQLSVAATAGMVALAAPLGELAGRALRLPSWLALAAGTTLGAQAGVTPLLLNDFGAVPTVTILANLLAFPAVSPGLLLGLAAGGLGIVWHQGGAVLAWFARLPLGYLESMAGRLAHAPLPTITSPGGRTWELLGWYAALALLAWRLRRGPRGRAQGAQGAEAGASRAPAGARLIGRAAVAGALALALILRAGAFGAAAPRAFTVVFMDVGQGDAALIRSPGGATILIDGGPDAEVVATKLAALGVHRLDLMVATHQHADHVGGLPAVLARVPVGLVLDPGCRGASPYWAAYLRALSAARAPVRHPRPGEVLRIADVTIRVLGPERCFIGTNSDPNNDSLVLLVRDGPASVLFTGDAEQPSQTDLLRDEAPFLRALVLKVPHHGGGTSLPEFLAGVGARLAVVSVGPNRYGHPVPQVLAQLAADGMRVLRTDRAGDVTVSFAGGGLSVQSSRG